MLSFRSSARIIIGIFSIIIVFHILVLLQIIPYTIVWGGKLQSKEDMYRFEIVSTLLNMLMLLNVLFYTQILKSNLKEKIFRYGLWVMFSLFVLNTIGNLFAENLIEKAIFTPLTFILAVLCLHLATHKKPKQSED